MLKTKKGDGSFLMSEKKKLTQIKSGFLECGGDCASCKKWEQKNITSGEMVLVKKRVSTKYVPPETALLKLVKEEFEGVKRNENIESLSDEELKRLEQELLDEIKNEIL